MSSSSNLSPIREAEAMEEIGYLNVQVHKLFKKKEFYKKQSDRNHRQALYLSRDKAKLNDRLADARRETEKQVDRYDRLFSTTVILARRFREVVSELEELKRQQEASP